MLDHIGFDVSDFEKSKAFYSAILGPLGYSLLMDVSEKTGGGVHAAGFGADGKAAFWIGEGDRSGKGHVHLAFAAKSREAVDKFYDAAIKAGGKDNGPPGLRPQYHENYYAAFVLDPDCHNVEAVCHAPGEFADQFPGVAL